MKFVGGLLIRQELYVELYFSVHYSWPSIVNQLRKMRGKIVEGRDIDENVSLGLFVWENLWQVK